jgi:hypothetical protein
MRKRLRNPRSAAACTLPKRGVSAPDAALARRVLCAFATLHRSHAAMTFQGQPPPPYGGSPPQSPPPGYAPAGAWPGHAHAPWPPPGPGYQPPAPRKKNLTALWVVLGVVGVLAGLCVVGAIVGPRSGTAPGPTMHALGESWSLGRFRYEVTAVESRTRLGNELTNEVPTPGSVFVVVNYVETNTGSESYTGITENATLRDTHGRIFRASSRAHTAIAMSGGTRDLIVTELHPNVPHASVIAFEVPIDVPTAPVDLVFEERGIFGSGRATVRAVVVPR